VDMLRVSGGLTAAIAVLGMAVPAEAQRRGDGRGNGGRGHHHRQNDKIDVGGALLGAVLIGGIIALTSSDKKRRARAEVYETEYDASQPDSGSPVPDMPAPNAAEYDGLYDMDAAADRCASEAETLGQNYARLSRVSSVGSTTWNGKSWVVKGKVELADSYTDDPKRTAKFRCALRAGSAPQVTFEGL
jgi:hypothetical protein